MDLMKSLDNILTGPYTGPSLSSLHPLLQRNNLNRPVRNPSIPSANSPVRPEIPPENTLNRFPVSDIPKPNPTSSQTFATSQFSFSQNQNHKQAPILIEDSPGFSNQNPSGQKHHNSPGGQEELLSAPNFFSPFDFGNSFSHNKKKKDPKPPKEENNSASSFVHPPNSFGHMSVNVNQGSFGDVILPEEHQSQVHQNYQGKHEFEIQHSPATHHRQNPGRHRDQPALTHHFMFREESPNEHEFHFGNSEEDVRRPPRNTNKFVTFDEAINIQKDPSFADVNNFQGFSHTPQSSQKPQNSHSQQFEDPQSTDDYTDVHVHHFINTKNVQKPQKNIKPIKKPSSTPKWGFFHLPNFFKRNRSRREARHGEAPKPEGFITGKPSRFPDFQQLGGFGPHPEFSAESSNFVPDFQLPSLIETAKTDGLKFPPEFEVDSRIFSETSDRTKRSASEHLESSADQISAFSHHHRTVGRKGVNLQPRTLIRVPRQFNPFLPFHPPPPPHRFGSQPYFQPFVPHQKQNRKGAFDGNNGFHSNQRHPKSISSFHGGNHFNGGHHSPGPLPLAPHLPAGLSGGGQSAGSRPEQSNQHDHEPEYNSFASNQFEKQRPLDNSLLGSGNFAIIKGGTFYGKDDPHLNHHPYDHFLDNGPVYYAGNRPHTNNHVDDFFSNFRDFSEFAARRSDIKEAKYDGSFDEGFFERGFASEHLPVVYKMPDMMASESLDDKIEDGTNNNISQRKKDLKRKTKKARYSDLKMREIKLKKKLKDKTKSKPEKKKSQKRKPKNIQDVLKEIDANPSYNPTYHAIDPLIAMF